MTKSDFAWKSRKFSHSKVLTTSLVRDGVKNSLEAIIKLNFEYKYYSTAIGNLKLKTDRDQKKHERKKLKYT